MRIVIADDSVLMLERLQKMLSLIDNVEVLGVYRNGTDALAGLKTFSPDLAILDNKMPGLNGVDIIREVRKENHTIKLMLLTFYSDLIYQKQAMEAGADYFFSKSDDFEKIPELIDQLKKIDVIRNR
ncbi:MAG: response regulator transcription factor [Porphyromonadaceae bacterium]|jgi:DNA-binding NarL/FixJ family response regulator|nr:response regulator transcription factor [Porphyromonadaceae bacterium]